MSACDFSGYPVRVIAIIQARMGSTRLPGKVLADLGGAPMLLRVLERVRQAQTVSKVVVATTTQPADEVLLALCRGVGVECHAGSEEDVLDRYYRVAQRTQADIVVRVTADCPLIDPEVIDRVVQSYLDRYPAVHYVSNVVPHRTYPRGLDTEVFGWATLERAWKEDQDPRTREHVTPYIYRHPEKFVLHCLTADADHSRHRWTVDTPEDLALAQRVYAAFGGPSFSWKEVIRLLEANPDWVALNADVPQKRVE